MRVTSVTTAQHRCWTDCVWRAPSPPNRRDKDLPHQIDIDQSPERDVYGRRPWYTLPAGFDVNQEILYAKLRDGGTSIEEALA